LSTLVGKKTGIRSSIFTACTTAPSTTETYAITEATTIIAIARENRQKILALAARTYTKDSVACHEWVALVSILILAGLVDYNDAREDLIVLEIEDDNGDDDGG